MIKTKLWKKNLLSIFPPSLCFPFSLPSVLSSFCPFLPYLFLFVFFFFLPSCPSFIPLIYPCVSPSILLYIYPSILLYNHPSIHPSVQHSFLPTSILSLLPYSHSYSPPPFPLFFFLGPHTRHMEVPRTRGSNWTCSCWPTP